MKYLLILLFYLCPRVESVCVASPDKGAQQASSQADAFERGLTALKENRFQDAVVELSAAEREHPDDQRIRNFRGISLARMGRDAEAAAEYQEAIRLDPLLEDAYRNLGFLRWTEGQFTQAREALERAVKLSPDDSFAHYYLGRVELDAQRYEQAFHELELSHQPFPADPGFLLKAAAGYIALGDHKNARKSLQQLINLPLNETQSLQAASLLLSIHENDSAIEIIQKLGTGYSPAQSRRAQFDLALAYFLAGKFERAVEKALICTEPVGPPVPVSPDRAQAWSLIGITYAHMNLGEPSINALRQAAALEPSAEEHWLNLTRELMELNRYPEAITAVQNGLAANPKSYALHLRLGAAYLAAGRYVEAESVFRDLVAAGDPLPTGYIGLAQVLLRTGRAEEAATELGDAEKKLGPTFLICYFRGLALDRVGKPAEALAAFQEAVQLNSTSGEAHFNLGKMEFALGHVKEAITELQEALRLTPGDKQATRLLSQAYRRAGDSKNAVKYAEASTGVPAPPAGDLLGDFFVPQWQVPLQDSEN